MRQCASGRALSQLALQDNYVLSLETTLPRHSHDYTLSSIPVRMSAEEGEEGNWPMTKTIAGAMLNRVTCLQGCLTPVRLL